MDIRFYRISLQRQGSLSQKCSHGPNARQTSGMTPQQPNLSMITTPFFLDRYGEQLGSFHNLYTKIETSATSSAPTIANESADRLPRVTGDNYVVFNSADGQPPSSNNPFWNQMPMPRNVAISSRLNYFRTLDKKPGPRKHPIQPVLVEVKYSHIPTISDDGYLSLAMYPSVAFWNPYNVGLDMDQLFVEIPLHQVYINAFNPKDFDRWRKWFFYAFNPDFQPGGGPNVGRPLLFPWISTGGLRGSAVGLTGFQDPLAVYSKMYFYSLVHGMILTLVVIKLSPFLLPSPTAQVTTEEGQELQIST